GLAPRTRSWSSLPAIPASSTPTASACSCPNTRFRRTRQSWSPPAEPPPPPTPRSIPRGAAVLGRGAQPDAAEGPRPPGDRGRLPGRGDPLRSAGRSDPGVDGREHAEVAHLVPDGGPPRRARLRG